MRWLILLLVSMSALAAEPSIVADKTSGVIYIHRLDDSIDVFPALFGRTLSDDVSQWERQPITPSGVYELHRAWSPKMNSYILYFLKGKKHVAAIHPVYTGKPEQRRLERLLNGTPEDNRITNGCINVTPESFQMLMELPVETRLTVLKEGETYRPPEKVNILNIDPL